MVVTMSTKESSTTAVGKRRQRRRRRQTRKQEQQQQQYGMDTAPPLVSLSSSSSFQGQQQHQDFLCWQRRRTTADSLQRWCTLDGNASSVCPPLVMPPRYVVSVCHNGILRFFDMMVGGHPFDHDDTPEPFLSSSSSSTTLMDPHWSIETNLQGPTAMATDPTNNNNNNENHIAAIDVNGTVSLVAYSSSSSSDTGNPPPQVVQTFQTDTPNATCIGWNQHHRTITIGYQCGQLEEWQVPHSSSSSPPRRRPSPSSLPVLLWRGTLGDPVASLQPTLGMHRHKHCAVCIQQRVKPILERPLHSASVQVLDRSTLMQQYQAHHQQQQRKQQQLQQQQQGRRQLMDLLPFAVWPENGFQSVDPAHVQPALQNNKSDAALLQQQQQQQQTRSVPFGSNIMAACPNAVAAALFDGSVGVLHSLVQETNDDDDNADDDDRQSPPLSSLPSLQWGIAHEANRVVLSHPSIGLGFLQYQERNHVVCCLRGGTIYLLPIVDKLPTSTDDDNYPPVTVLYRPIPHDPDNNLQQQQEDPLLFHLHSFACGNLVWDAAAAEDHQEQRNSSIRSLPIVVYMGPAGLMEVYVCGLSTSSTSSTCCQQEPPPVVQEMVLEEMLANGTVQQLVDTLHSPNHHELNNEIWTRARTECRACPPRNPADVLLLLDDDDDDNHPKYPHMVALLLHLAKL